MLRSALSSPSLVAAALVLSTRQAQCLSAEAGGGVHFAGLRIAPSQLVCESEHCVAIAAPQPIVPGHVLVAPRRAVARLDELHAAEAAELWSTAREAQRAIAAGRFAPGGRVAASAFNLALKDGAGAGQPVAHVHAHIVPRAAGDLARNDEVYNLIDRWSPRAGETTTPPPFPSVPDELRRARTPDEMAAEADAYAAAAAGAPELAGARPSTRVRFGPIELAPSQVFAVSPSGRSLATVNLKPLLPGHVLVIPARCVPRTEELTDEELGDLWRTARAVQLVVQRCVGADAATIGVQDGRDAGQSVPHVHVHILPR